MNKVKSFEEACQVLNLDATKLPIVDMIPEAHQKHIIAAFKLAICADAWNTDETGKRWMPDYSNWNQYKYQPVFYCKEGESPSGSGFSFGVGDLGHVYGCRLAALLSG
jgi:hypothetical protein